jgi:KDO2-lipid IV(A) lauroyltransferase
LYALTVGLTVALACLPLSISYWIGARLGELAYLCLGRRRRVTMQNLALVFAAEKTVAERRRLARATFRHLGQHVVDFSRLRYLTRQRFSTMCSIEGWASVEELLARRAGLLMLSAHFGSWELSTAIALLLSVPLHVIVRPPDHPVLRRLVAAYRQRCGFHALPHRQAFPASLQALRRGEIVALLMDQSSQRQSGIQLEFCGVPAYTTMAPALLALRTGCPVISAFLVRTGHGRHRLIFTPEIVIHRTGDLRKDIETNTRQFNQIIEAYIRQYPDHWFWLHRRWKQRT